MTRWLRQTKSGGGNDPAAERGDCVPACIASILGLPITAIANCHGEGWWDRLNAEVGRYGFCLVQVDPTMVPRLGLWIASLPSLNLPPEPDGRVALHCVVARGFDLVHDPALLTRYDATSWDDAWEAGAFAEAWVLVPLDPAVLAGRA